MSAPVVPGFGDYPTQPILMTAPPAPKSRKAMWIAIASVVAALLGVCCIGMVTMSLAPSNTEVDVPPQPVYTSPTPEPRPSASKRPAKAAEPVKPKPQIADGTWHVGEDIPAGTYRVRDRINSDQSCYWEKNRDAEGRFSGIISNGAPDGGRPQVTLRKGQWFETQDCGVWVKR